MQLTIESFRPKKLEPKNNFKTDISISSAVVLQFSKGIRRACSLWEKEFIEKANLGSFEIPTADDDVIEEISTPDTTKLFIPNADLVNKYFPGVWSLETLNATEQEPEIEKVTSITTKNDTSDPPKFFIKANFPRNLKVGEIFMLDVQIFNELNDMLVGLSIDVDNKALEVVKKEKDNGTITFKRIPTTPEYLNVNSSSSVKHVIFVRTLQGGKGKINIEAHRDKVSDKIKSHVNIEYEGVTQYKSNPMLINVNDTRLFKQEISIDLPDNVELPAVRVVASVSGNIFGPLLERIVGFE